MRIKSCAVLWSALAALAFASATSAQTCAGFIDVPSGSAFCPNVEWLKNRQVTAGCSTTDPTVYCPNNPVTRLQMAAFLNRLGIALTPIELTPVSSAATPRNLSTQIVICQTADFPVTGFPRRAYVNGAAHLSVPTANVDVLATVQFSTNSGASWTPITGSNTYASVYTGGSPGNHVTLAPFSWQDINVGQTVRFGVGLSRFIGSGDVTAGCNLSAQIANRDGVSSPF